MFCSSACHDKILKTFKSNVKNIAECLTDDDIKRKMSIILNDAVRTFGNIAMLRENFSQTSVNKTIFDFDWNGLSDEEMKRAVYICNISTLPKSDSHIRKYLETTIQIPNIELRTFLVDFISRLILNYLRNGVKVSGKCSAAEPLGGMFLPFVSLLNHSCDPNIHVSFIENQAIVTVIRPIKANEQIFVCYRYFMILI